MKDRSSSSFFFLPNWKTAVGLSMGLVVLEAAARDWMDWAVKASEPARVRAAMHMSRRAVDRAFREIMVDD